MTRTKEVDPNSEDMPNYKSPAARLVHSLRKGYNNLRIKLSDSRNKIKYYQIRTRDLENSREHFKEQVATLKMEKEELMKKLSKAETKIAKMESQQQGEVKKKI